MGGVPATARTGWISAIVVVALCLYGGLWIWSTSFVVEGQRTFCLSDDQMISMRYARHLAAGQGLVWNPGGERVEGFSNPAWVLVMALVHLLPLTPSVTSLVVQCVGLVCLLANLLVVRGIYLELCDRPCCGGLVPVVLTAFYFPLNYWSLMGFEVGALVLVVDLAVLRVLRSIRRGTADLAPGLLLGLACWLRLDAAVVALVVAVGFPVLVERRLSRQRLVAWLGPVVGALLVQTGLRWLYYGQPLPNTYHLKMTGYPLLLRLSRGAFAVLRWLASWTGLVLAAPLVQAILATRPRRRAVLLAVVAQIGYSVWVGGDVWEWWGIANRFAVVVMPLVFVLFALVLDDVVAWLQARHHVPLRRGGFLAVCVAVVALLGVNTGRGDSSSWWHWITLTLPFDEVAENRTKVELGAALESLLGPDDSVMLYWAGTIPYFFDREYVDLLGKSDPAVARLPARQFDPERPILGYNNFLGNRYTFFYPGHLKWDYDHSIGELEPDAILQLWVLAHEARPWLEAHYEARFLGQHRVWIRR
jgi:hypothetical protein